MLQVFADDASDYIDRQYKYRLDNLNRMVRKSLPTSDSDNFLSKSEGGLGGKINKGGKISATADKKIMKQTKEDFE